MDILTLIFYSIYLMIPAYLANGSALVFGGGTPMDFGHYCWDNRRLLVMVSHGEVLFVVACLEWLLEVF